MSGFGSSPVSSLCSVSVVSGKTSQRRRRNSVDRTLSDTEVRLKVSRCFFPGCIEPTPPPPATLPPLPAGRPDDFMYVSALLFLLSLFTPGLMFAFWDAESTRPDVDFLKTEMCFLFLCSLWSNASYWQTSAENNFTAPAEGADVVIPSGNVQTKTRK